MKQMCFSGFDDESTTGNAYTSAAGSPLYVPKARVPNVIELHDNSRTYSLLRDINASGVSEKEKAFLTAAAHRHTVFNYELIADYYAHASPEMQKLMEASALVIVDFDQAIEQGYVKLCKRVNKLYREVSEDDAT